MIAWIGSAGVLLALAGAVGLVAAGAVALRGSSTLARRALRPMAGLLLAGAIVAMGALEAALLLDDFSLAYTARNHSSQTPLLFTIATAWAALEGSIVLWGLVLAGFTWGVARTVGPDDRLGAGALAVMGLVAVFFFGIMASVADPFVVIDPVPADGPGPNPLLQNHPLMALHPPLLYLGFVGFTVPFAFAISALVVGDAGSRWLARTRRWNLLAWSFLTAGIVAGAWWSYEVLGWGGYWAWDPVENASLLPWLTGTALIHSAVVQTRRGMLQAWNVALAIATFALTILGTFLTRSGVIASVHSFTESHIGPVFLAFLVAVLVGGYGLFATRAHLVAGAPRLESLASREGAFLLNNLLLTLFAVTVLIGTLYPIFVEAASGVQVSVGRPFFDRTTVPIALVLLLAMGVGPLLPYRLARAGVVWQRVRIPLLVGIAAGAVLVLAGVRTTGVVLVAILATAITTAMLRQFVISTRALAKGPTNRWRAAWEVPRRNPGYWGGQLSHLGIAVAAVAIAVSGSFGTITSVSLDAGGSAPAGPYTLTLAGTFERDEGNRIAHGAAIELRRDGRTLTVLEPAINEYRNQVQPIGTPAVWTGLTQDVYVVVSSLGSDQVTLEVRRFPFKYLLWVGGFLAAAGGLWAVWGRRSARHADAAAVVADTGEGSGE